MAEMRTIWLLQNILNSPGHQSSGQAGQAGWKTPALQMTGQQASHRIHAR